ncbi:MAG: ABC transporter permease [Balneolales bacterium]
MRKQKLRSFLTLLAISWGTLSVVLLLAFGKGVGNQMLSGMLGAGNQIMILYGGQTSIGYEGLGVGRRVRFVEEDVDMLLQAIPQIRSVSPQYGQGGVRLKSELATTNTFMEGVAPEFGFMRTMYASPGGRFINEQDIVSQRRVVFLGNEIAERLFGEESAVGQTLMLDDVPFTVVGVMQEKLQTSMNNGPDANRAIIPYSTFREMYGHRYLNSILVRPADVTRQEYIKGEIFNVFGRKYQFDPSDEQALGVWDFIENERINRQVSFGIELFLFSVGFFTLLIAGVGVANIMYVVVRERTQEIGIKKALGAKKIHIVSQFMFESVFVSFLGGAIGLSISILIVRGVHALDMNEGAGQFLGHPVLSEASMLLTFSILALIGIAAGVFPAKKAAGVDPVESLRYE